MKKNEGGGMRTLIIIDGVSEIKEKETNIEKLPDNAISITIKDAKGGERIFCATIKESCKEGILKAVRHAEVNMSRD